MKDNMLSLVSAVAGIASFFLSGMIALGVAFGAVMLAFFAGRRKEKLYVVGMLLGAVVLIFVNLQNMGIIKSAAKTEIETLYSSMRLSNQAFAMLQKENPAGVGEVLAQALDIARSVDVELVDHLLPGFKTHFELEYIEGLTLFNVGLANSDICEKLKGAVLVDLWAIWSGENMDRLEEARQKTPSLVAFIF